MKGRAYRYENEAPWTDEESWRACVASVLGPQFKTDPAGKRRRDALHLAAAALRAAGESSLAEQAENLLT
ncbi:hypothetical protein QO239_03715 [Cupriavidus taiwanensis]|uniref:hypothetical protein n=1 Tax=Cupriavidus taiwanensis TaxID=164546 RepID=UPI0025401608|nr:hypothetical protein [Cupriavidus taiwanensis]MDK3021713.1 hypothetical protein [Cupriavidus taiwanensis]